MNFEWDDTKNRINVQKHGINFLDIHRVFDGPIIVRADERDEYGELRWQCTRYLINHIVVVIYAERENDTIRLISARKALQYERKRFEQELSNRFDQTRSHDR